MLSDHGELKFAPACLFSSQCPLEHCMLSDYRLARAIARRARVSQCPLEHCMLSD